MTAILGTNVAAMVVPFDTADIYATHSDKYGRGGFRTVDDLVERDEIKELRRREGMWVRVVATDEIYELWGGITNSDWRRVNLSGVGSQFPQVNTELIISNGGITVDALPLTYFKSVKWIIYAETELLKNYHFEMSAIISNNIPKFTKYANLGERINIKTDLSILNNVLRLTLINNESVKTSFSILRIPILR